jgi:hypothetical protein
MIKSKRPLIIRAKIEKSGEMTLSGLPFDVGDDVAVTIELRRPVDPSNLYPLRGKMFRYDDPYEPVAEDDWEVLK